ncbi:MAG: ABC transporter ATP-binding protein [Lachnospiraceae bacterium]|nr:ABC transporter ATP-binding protein [Lachnospiraceae bacterium]
MQEHILEIKNLTKYYGKVKGVENLSLAIDGGEIFGFIGPNGAGKSTTIRSVMNLINKNSGTVKVCGKEFLRDDTETKRMIGYLPSEVFLYDDLTVGRIFDYHESFYAKQGDGKAIHERKCELVERLKLDESKMIEDLSLGNLKKTGIILALMHSPKLVIMDEPTSGLDPIIQNVFYELLLEERERGTAIFYSTHILSEISKICDRVGIIRNGELIKVEKTSELSDKNLTFVTVKSKDKKKIIDDLGVKPVSEDEEQIRFANTLPDDVLIKKLAAYKIDRILIEEATLEEMFMHYYTEE